MSLNSEFNNECVQQLTMQCLNILHAWKVSRVVDRSAKIPHANISNKLYNILLSRQSAARKVQITKTYENVHIRKYPLLQYFRSRLF